ncbi:GNAT family N-acetyltransferase [Streptomyces sp. NPDC048445]|uniref:GNAT family N-acetyltransferase n=1 Tax=Streptomyces sp. NPDC048445 TaxID=3365553 RepID=UPI00371E3535
MTSGMTAEPVILDAKELTSDPELEARFTESAHRIPADLVGGGAALGWIEPHAAAHGRGVGRALTAALIADARETGIEVLTLDARGDNTNALHLYRSLGFTEYGRLPDFVAVGEHRYHKVFYMLDFRRQS